MSSRTLLAGYPLASFVSVSVNQLCGLRPEFAVLDEGCDYRPVVAAFVGSREQGVFAIERDRADCALDDVAVEVDATIIEKAREPFPTREGVAHGFAELALGTDLAASSVEIAVQIIDNRAAAFIAQLAALFSGAPRASASMA